MFIGQMDDVYEDLKDDGLVAWVILIQDDQFQYPDAAYCEKYKKFQEIEMRVLYDPTGATSIYGGKETSIITNEAATIVFEAHADLTNQITQAIIGELSALPGECSDSQICQGDDKCMPKPVGDKKKCTALCVVDDAASCPDGQVCWQYQAGATTGACFDSSELPAE